MQKIRTLLPPRGKDTEVRALLGRSFGFERFFEVKGVGGVPLPIDDFDFDLTLTARGGFCLEVDVRSSFLRLVSDLGRGSPEGGVEVSLDGLAMEDAPLSSSFRFRGRDLTMNGEAESECECEGDIGSGEIGCGRGVVGESEWEGESDGEDDEEDKSEAVAGSGSAVASVNFLRFCALIARGVGSGVIGAMIMGSRVRGEGVEGNDSAARSCSFWSGSSWNLGRLRERELVGVGVTGVLGVVVASNCLGLLLVEGDLATTLLLFALWLADDAGVVNAVDDDGVGGRAICLVLRRTGRGKGVEGLLGIYCTAICAEKADLGSLLLPKRRPSSLGRMTREIKISTVAR